MTINYPLTPLELDTARDVLGYYGLEGGYTPGGFTSKLIALLEVADVNNRYLLLDTFPQFHAAIKIMNTQGGEALVQAVKENAK